MVSPGIPRDSVLGEGSAIEGLEGQANSREPPPEVSVTSRVLSIKGFRQS